MGIIQPSRRRFITGLASLIAAPAIVRASSLMPVRAPKIVLELYGRSPAMEGMAGLFSDTDPWFTVWGDQKIYRSSETARYYKGLLASDWHYAVNLSSPLVDNDQAPGSVPRVS